ncbi:hypothetical protein H0H92_015800 [Tricholoma furcatifolium]|nr:hypothetical protein H0H92_015800 [Tricholoma furcatifolium]
MAVWSRNRYIIALLVVLILAHWSLILQGMSASTGKAHTCILTLTGVTLKATWIDGTGCVITATDNKVLAATFVYSMCFDFVVLALNAYKLLDIGMKEPGLTSSKIAKMIFEDGLIFFVVAFVANLLATVFMVLNLNQIMSVIFNVPAAVASTIVASRVVRRLTNYTNPLIFPTSESNHIAFRGAGTSFPGRQTAVQIDPEAQKRGGVHVQMETFTHQEVDDVEIMKIRRQTREESDTENDLEVKNKGL